MEQVEPISREEFNNWKENRVTQAVMQGIAETLELQKNYLASGGTLSKDADETTDRIVGRIEGLIQILNVDYEESEQEKREAYDH